MKFRKLALVTAVTLMTAASAMTGFAAVPYSDWHYAKFGKYPDANISSWEQDPVYWQYLAENDPALLTALRETYSDVYGDDENTNQLDYVDVAYAKSVSYAMVKKAYWSGSKAKWTIEGAATKYQIRVYRDDSRVSTKNTTKMNISLSSAITKSGYYYFEVRAYNENGGWSEWEDSDEKYFSVNNNSNKQTTTTKTTTTTTTTTSTNPQSGGSNTASTGQWLRAADGSGKWWYRHANGSYTSNDWELINGKWYYFDVSGWMMTGWLNVRGATYYLGMDGAMLTGTNFVDGVKRSFDTSGKLVG